MTNLPGWFKGIGVILWMVLIAPGLAVGGLAQAADPDFLTPHEREWLKQHPKVLLGVDPAWAPFEYFDSQGHYQGLASSYVDVIGGLLGIQMKPLAGLSWSEAVEKGKRGELDVFPCVVNTSQRREFLSFTKAYLDFPMVIVTRDNAGFVSGINAVLKEKIGVVAGYASFDLLSTDFPDMNFKKFSTLEEGLEAVALGRLDYFVDNLASISHVIKQKGLTNLKIAAQTPYSFKLGFGVRKDWPELVTILDKALAQISQDTRNRIQSEWISVRFDYGVDVRNLVFGGLLLLALIAVLYFYYFFRSRMLQAQLREKEKDNLIGQIAQALDAESGSSFFKTLVRELAGALRVDFAFVGNYQSGQKKVNTLAFFGDGNLGENFSYDLKNTPCQITMEKSACIVPDSVVEHYPDDGILVDMEIEGYAGIRLNNSSGKPLGILVVMTHKEMRDVELKERLLKIFAVRAAVEIERQHSADSLRKLSLAVQYSPNAVVITDVKGIIEYVNPQYFALTGYSTGDVIGEVHQTLRAGGDNAERQMNIMYHLHAGKPWQGEIRNTKKSGGEYWVMEHIAPILDDKGIITHFVAMQQDITEAYKASQKMSYQAAHDSLTGLINRNEFEIRLEQAVLSASQNSSHHALCFLDLDQFKVVNDTSGHVAGDEMLKQIGGLLKEHLRETDTLARLGGDEFAVLIQNCSIEQARIKAEDILSVIEDYRFAWEDKIFTVGVSIGICSIDSSTATYIDALKYADIACYAAKDAGRNRVHVYESSDENLMQRSGEMLWAPRIAKALEHDQFRLFVQEIKPTDLSKDYVHYEVLLRMVGDDGELIPPGAFLPTAERYNLINRLDMWVIDHAFEWLKRNAHRCHPEMHFTINLSGQSMCEESVLQHVTALLDSGFVPASKMQFEVTETMAIANLQQANHFIDAVKSYGCGFSLDDFGSGLSSFGYLKNLNVDTLKIDGMFVRDILDDPIDAAMVNAINTIGHVMGMKTVAEFVENEMIAVKMFEMKVDYVQGYGIGKPMPIEEIPLLPG